jgi:hypothetical protein
MPTGEMLGSPYYMPPEQAGGRLKTGGPWSDVYSLGAILYFLITGRPPFLGDSIEDTLTQVLQKEPVAPRLLVPRIPRDLQTICLKCLQKEPHRRYQTARELADELQRFLNGQPILARLVGSPEKLWRWCRREPAVASLSGIAALVLVIGAILVLWQWRQTEYQRARAERLLETNRHTLYLQDMRFGFTSLDAHELAPLRAALISQIPPPGKADLRGFEWRYLWARAFPDGARRLPVSHGFPGEFLPCRRVLGRRFEEDLHGIALMRPHRVRRRAGTLGPTRGKCHG